jgi:hypothetical protein
MHAFESLEGPLIRQMCQVLCPIGKNDSEVEMSMDEAIQVGILDVSRTESIEKFPTVYRNPNWTLWHQLKSFFLHYSRDADAPMFTSSGILQFWLPPVLHERVKKTYIHVAFIFRSTVKAGVSGCLRLGEKG